MKYIFLTILSVFSIIASAQISRCGLPNYIPRKGEAWVVTDTCGGKLSYLYKGNAIWECLTTTFVQESAPQLSQIVGSVTVRWRETRWYKPSTGVYYDGTTGAWQTKQFLLDSLLSRNNVWTGKNTFTDTTKFNAGIKSDGLIDTKGLNTEGSVTKAAAHFSGVQSRKDTTITSNYSMTGQYGEVRVITGATNKTLTLPSVSGDGWFWVIHKVDDDAGLVIVRDASNNLVYEIRSKMSVTIKQISSNNFKRVQ